MDTFGVGELGKVVDERIKRRYAPIVERFENRALLSSTKSLPISPAPTPTPTTTIKVDKPVAKVTSIDGVGIGADKMTVTQFSNVSTNTTTTSFATTTTSFATTNVGMSLAVVELSNQGSTASSTSYSSSSFGTSLAIQELSS